MLLVLQNKKRFGQPGVLKYLLRLLRSKHYVGAKDQGGVSDPGVKKPVAQSTTAVEMMEIPLPVLVTNLLVQIMMVRRYFDMPVRFVYVSNGE